MYLKITQPGIPLEQPAQDSTDSAPFVLSRGLIRGDLRRGDGPLVMGWENLPPGFTCSNVG